IGKCGPLDPNTRFAALGRAVDIFVDELNQTPQQELVCLASYSTNVRFPCNCCPQVISVNPTTGQPDQTDPCPRVGRGCGGPTQYFVEFNEAEIHSNLSPDTNALRGPIQAMINRGIGGGTSIGSGLQQGMAAVTGANSRPFAFPTIILMTDGNHNNGIGPEVVAQQALNDGIVVHTITFSPGANQALMKQVAETTGGRHLHADSEDDLKDAFRALARTLPVMLTQ
ncbi:MAG: vWA domain-containing protein, partial [Planctomycetota bacterium]